MKITIWGDFACPFCYMGETLLESVISESSEESNDNIEVEYRAYQLDKDSPEIPVETMEEHFCKEHNLTSEEARQQMERITKMAARAGLEYNLAGVKVCNTLDAHRLMNLAYDVADNAVVKKLNFGLFHANFIENKLLSDHNVLKGIALDAGLDSAAVDATLGSDKYAESVYADEKEAEAFDLEYVPYMRFSDGRILQGVISKGAMRKALDPDVGKEGD